MQSVRTASMVIVFEVQGLYDGEVCMDMYEVCMDKVLCATIFSCKVSCASGICGSMRDPINE